MVSVLDSWYPVYTTSVIILLILMLATEMGYQAGVYDLKRHGTKTNAPLNTILAAVLGLLGLLLAFTYSFVTVRSDMRKQAVIEEANALGTAYWRATLVREPYRTEMMDLLREYTRSRIASAGVVNNPEELQKAIVYGEKLQGQLWQAAQKQMGNRPSTPIDAILLSALNQVFDMHTRRLAAARDRLPFIILGTLCFVAIIAMGLTGYGGGVDQRRHFILYTLMSVLFAVVIGVIIDLDHPQSGHIRVSQQSLIDTIKGMEPEGSGATTPSTLPASR